jgi:EmrB/QacA subfamily drug resistance transporter
MQNALESFVDRKTGRWVLFATILASSMAFIDFTALNVALPVIQSTLSATGPQILWVANGYNLMLASLILVGGSLGDKLGRKKVYAAGILLFTAASIFCGSSPSIGFLIAGRVAQGVGGALMVPGSLALITASFGPDRRGGAIGTWSAVTTLVMIAGPVLGGFLAQSGLWRFIFFINVPLAAAALIALARFVPESREPGPKKRLDLAGAALITASLVGLTYGFTSASELGFGNPGVALSLSAGFLALVGFVIAENRIVNPLLPFDVFKSRTFTGANLLTLFLYGALAAYTLFLSLNVIQIQGYREAVAGLVLLPFVVLLAGMSRWTGKLVDRIGPKWLLTAGPLVVGVGFFLTSLAGLTDGPRDYWRKFFPAIFLFGVGMGLTVAPLTTTVMSALDTRLAGTASGVNNAVARIAGVLAIAILGTVALSVFKGAVADETSRLSLPPTAREEVMGQALRFGGAAVPGSVPRELAGVVERSLKTAFVDSFRVLMYLCAGLAWLSALAAAVLVGRPVARADQARAGPEG